MAEEIKDTVEEAEEKPAKKSKGDKKLENEIEALKKQLEEKENEIAEQKEQYLRIAAEYEIFRRRSKAEREGVYSEACSDIVNEFLPVLDNIERAAAFATDEKVAEGISMMAKAFGESLAKLGVEEIEAKIFNDLAMIETEFERAESKIFADPLILRKGSEIKRHKTHLEQGSDAIHDCYKIPEGVFPINRREGDIGASIDIFSPVIRYSEYQSKLLDDMKRYEQQIGTDRGFLTPFDNGTATTATEIRRANASTIALIDKIHTAIKSGVEATLKADAVFLNVADDLWSTVFDFYDPFDDPDKQYERIVSAVDRGVLEKEDELRWLYPNMTDEEIAEKLARIQANSQANTDMALERILQGQ